MSLKKCGIIVDCGHCEYASGGDHGSFEVTVPLSDVETGTEGSARLRCSVSAQGHEVTLEAWTDAQAGPIMPAPRVRQRLTKALGHVADHRICGNQQICPSEVVRIVERQTRR